MPLICVLWNWGRKRIKQPKSNTTTNVQLGNKQNLFQTNTSSNETDVPFVPVVPDECLSLVQSLEKVERESLIVKKVLGQRTVFVMHKAKRSQEDLRIVHPNAVGQANQQRQNTREQRFPLFRRKQQQDKCESRRSTMVPVVPKQESSDSRRFNMILYDSRPKASNSNYDSM